MSVTPKERNLHASCPDQCHLSCQITLPSNEVAPGSTQCPPKICLGQRRQTVLMFTGLPHVPTSRSSIYVLWCYAQD